MNANQQISSAFRLIGFVLFVAAVVPAFRGDGINAGLLVPAIALWLVGIGLGIHARRKST